MKITVKDIIKSKRCITKEDGQKIYRKIHKLLKEKRVVTLDFSGTTQFSASFFNYAIGQLLKDITEKDLRRLLQIENLDGARKLIERVIKNTIEKKENDISHIVNNILKEEK